MVLLLAAAGAFAAQRPDLHLRSRILLRDIRVESASPTKDTSRLRAQLSALKAENSAAPDEKVTARLKAAEESLALVDAGSPLPPPAPEENISDEDLRDAVAQPAAPLRAPGLQDAAPAALPETAAPVFDGSIRRGGLTPPAVGVPPEDPEASLDAYLQAADDTSKNDVLTAASKKLLEKLREADKSGARADFLASMLSNAIRNHPRRASFLSLRVTVRKDKNLHLIYRARDGGAVDEILGTWVDWSTPRPGTKPKVGRPKKKSKKKADAGDGGDDASGSGHGGKKGHGGGKKGHGGGGGGGGDDDGGGGGAGRGGSGAKSHAKAPGGKGGAGMFDGGGDGGDTDGAQPGGGAMASGHGGRGRGKRKGRGAASAAGGDSGDAGAAEFGSGRAHVSAGNSLSGDGEAAGASGSPRRHKRGATVPLPGDFTSRGGGARLEGDGEGGLGPKGAGLGGFHFSSLGKKDFHRDSAAPPLPAAASRVTGTVLPQAKPAAAVQATPLVAAAAAGSAPPLSAPLAPEQDLHDAVAGNATYSSPSAVPAASPAPAAPVSTPPSGPGALAVACACAGALMLGAYAFRRTRRA